MFVTEIKYYLTYMVNHDCPLTWCVAILSNPSFRTHTTAVLCTCSSHTSRITSYGEDHIISINQSINQYMWFECSNLCKYVVNTHLHISLQHLLYDCSYVFPTLYENRSLDWSHYLCISHYPTRWDQFLVRMKHNKKMR